MVHESKILGVKITKLSIFLTFCNVGNDGTGYMQNPKSFYFCLKKLCGNIKNCFVLFYSTFRKTFLRERLADRQKALWKQYGFKCDCSACSHDYRISGLVDDLQIDQFNNINTIREEVSRNWVEIERNFDKQSPYKTAEIVAKNKFLLELVGSKFI